MGKARRNLAPVLGVDRTAARERDKVGGSRLTSADVTTSRRTRKIPDNVGRNRPARTVGARVAGKPPVLAKR